MEHSPSASFLPVTLGRQDHPQRSRVGGDERRRAAHVRVLIVHNDPRSAASLAGDLSGDETVSIAEPTSAAEALVKDPPDVLILDLDETPAAIMIALVDRVQSEAPETRLLALTATYPYGQGVMSSMFDRVTHRNAGVRPLSSIIARLTVSPRDPSVAETKAAIDPRSRDPNETLLARYLTAREKEVLAMLARGCSNADMARELGIQMSTVRRHLQNVFTKLQVHSRVEAVVFAVRNELVRVTPNAWHEEA